MPHRRPIPNPYYTGGPIKDPAQFFGRKKELWTLFDRVGKCQSVALEGEHRCGNTSLLWQMSLPVVQQHYLPADHALVFLFLDCQLAQSPEDFYRTLARAAVDQLPGTTIRSAMGSADEVLDLARAVRSDDRYLVLLLDEFECLGRFPPQFFTWLRGLATNYDVSYVTATRVPLEGCCPGNTAGSPLPNIFKKVYLGSFTSAELNEFLDTTSQRSGLPVNAYREDITRLGGRFPYFAQLACWHYFEKLKEGRAELTEKDRSAVRQQFADEALARFQDIWDGASAEERRAFVRLSEGQDDIPESVGASLMRKGYLVDGRLFSSAFNRFVRQHSATLAGPGRGTMGLWVDEETEQVFVSGNSVTEALSRLEFRLLAFLYRNRGKVCGKESIVYAVWGDDYIPGSDDPRITKLVSRVRSKLAAAAQGDAADIVAIRGRGYKLDV